MSSSAVIDMAEEACCTAVAAKPLEADGVAAAVPLPNALADPARLRLLPLVAPHADGEACVCDLQRAFDLSQPTISHHLGILHEAGPLREQRGVWVHHRVGSPVLSDLGASIGSAGR